VSGMKSEITTGEQRKSERGVALLMILFVVSLLVIIAAEFTYTTRMEITAALNFKEDIQGYYYALAGFQYALTEILGDYNNNYAGADGQVGFFRKWQEEAQLVAMGDDNDESVFMDWLPLPDRRNIRIGKGAFDYIITDEESKLNINYLNSRSKGKSNRDIFRELLIRTGVEEGSDPDIITDSVLDWIDRNDTHRLNGAETDWYEKNYREQGFSEPYTAKNGKLNTLDELIMIRGMTPEILYGSNSIYSGFQETDQQYLGIMPYITVFGYNRKINLDTAAPLLLEIIDPDYTEDQIEDRQNRDPKKRNRKSSTFRVQVRGYSLTSEVSHNLMAVVKKSNKRGGQSGAEILFWDDDALSFGSDLQSYVD